MLIEYSAKRMWRQQALLHVLVCLSSILLNLYLLQIMLGPLSNPCNVPKQFVQTTPYFLAF